jgi:hypothetical protein
LQKKNQTKLNGVNWEAVTAICSAFMTLCVFVALYEVSVTKKVATFEFMATLDDEFNSERIQKARERIVNLDFTNPDANELVQCEPLLNYFDKIAYLEDKRMIPLEAVNAYWGYWIERYWVLCEKTVYEWRAESPDDGYYEGTEILFKKLVKLYYKKSEVPNLEIYKNKIRKELEEFKMEEKQICGFYVNTQESNSRISVSLESKR